MPTSNNPIYIVLILVLLAGNVWQFWGTWDEPDVAAAPAPPRSGDLTRLENELAGVTQELREEQGARTKQSERAATLANVVKEQEAQIESLKTRLASLGDRQPVERVSALSRERTSRTVSREAPRETRASAPPPPAAKAVVPRMPSAPASATRSASVKTASVTPARATAPARATESANKTANSAEGPVVYVVKPGDVLQEIARSFYGNATLWQPILDANRDIISSPKGLRPGMKLKIPSAR